MRPGKLSQAPASFSQLEIPFRERVKAALAKLRENPDRDLSVLDQFQLSPDELEFVLKTAHLPADVDLNRYTEAWLRFRRQFAMPRMTNYLQDLTLILCQPEMLACLLGAWPYPPVKSTGPKPAYSGSKAVMLAMAAFGKSPHVDDAYDDVARSGETQRLLAWAFAEAGRRLDEPGPLFRLADVSRVRSHFRKLAATLGREAVRANVMMLRSFAGLFPNLPICHWAGIDGVAVPAWVRQKKGHTPDEEAVLRGRAAHAGFRFYGYESGGKVNVPEGAKVDVRKVKLWRGYYLVVLVDYCTGRPIVWTLIDASTDEARTLETLLQMLYEFWPDCPLQVIVGDGAWDKAWAHELCETRYGVHLVASRTSDERKVNATHVLAPNESETIAYFDGRGRAFCRAHNKPLNYVGNAFPKGGRNGLAPGEPAPAAQFRLRFECEDGCGTPSLQMQRHWTALAYYPHHSHGQRKRYAERYALLAHRNVCESLFNALKVGGALATVGADRLRLNDLDSVQALIDLSFCSGTAFLLAQEREKLGISCPMPSTDDLANAA